MSRVRRASRERGAPTPPADARAAAHPCARAQAPPPHTHTRSPTSRPGAHPAPAPAPPALARRKQAHPPTHPPTLEVAGEAGSLWESHVGSRGEAVAVEGRKRDLVKVNEPQAPHPRPQQQMGRVAAHALAGGRGGGAGSRWATAPRLSACASPTSHPPARTFLPCTNPPTPHRATPLTPSPTTTTNAALTRRCPSAPKNCTLRVSCSPTTSSPSQSSAQGGVLLLLVLLLVAGVPFGASRCCCCCCCAGGKCDEPASAASAGGRAARLACCCCCCDRIA